MIETYLIIKLFQSIEPAKLEGILKEYTCFVGNGKLTLVADPRTFKLEPKSKKTKNSNRNRTRDVCVPMYQPKPLDNRRYQNCGQQFIFLFSMAAGLW